MNIRSISKYYAIFSGLWLIAWQANQSYIELCYAIQGMTKHTIDRFLMESLAVLGIAILVAGIVLFLLVRSRSNKHENLTFVLAGIMCLPVGILSVLWLWPDQITQGIIRISILDVALAALFFLYLKSRADFQKC